MSFKNLSLFRGLSSIKSYEIDKRFFILILIGMVFILVFTLLGLALVELETEDSPFVEINRITRIRETFSYRMLVSGFPVGVFALILLFEFLRGHIGEKRFAEKANRVSFPFHIYPVFLTTARFGPLFAFMEANPNEHFV